MHPREEKVQEVYVQENFANFEANQHLMREFPFPLILAAYPLEFAQFSPRFNSENSFSSPAALHSFRWHFLYSFVCSFLLVSISNLLPTVWPPTYFLSNPFADATFSSSPLTSLTLNHP
ncbi:hypothetical protein AVEN_25278-1 [Araneus ventricosus]|uniref:Uncharacterized protein n=1 Tax=Araneus ventricosus TaxID=182803 RepID=A0A4Y2TT40_ARAVE|nr:hypothetical protein AVEN_25278-1 [Araneus ventricosus]